MFEGDLNTLNIKSVRRIRAILAGMVGFALSWSVIKPSVEIGAVLIRRRWSEAWFAGLIVWYADFFGLAFALAIAAIAGRLVWNKDSSSQVPRIR